MASPEVLRVRLTAEGIQEVVGSLRRLEGETKKVKKSVSGVGSDMKSALAGIGFAAAARGMAQLVKGAIDYQDKIEEMTGITGAAAEVVWTLGVAARKDGVELEVLSKGLKKFSQFMLDAQRGGAATTRTLSQMGLSVDVLRGKNIGEQMEIIARALEGRSGMDRTALSMELFGKAGADLEGVLETLSRDGFQKLQEEGRKTGEVITDDVAKAGKEAKAKMMELDAQVRGLTQNLTAGLVPGLTKAAEGFMDAAAEGANAGAGIRMVGQGIGWVAKVAMSAFVFMGKALGHGLANWAEFFEGVYDAIKTGGGAIADGFATISVSIGQAVQGNIGAARSVFKSGFAKIEMDVKELSTRMAGRFNLVKDNMFGSGWTNIKSAIGKIWEDQGAAAAGGGTKPDKKDLVIVADGTEKRAGQAIAAQAKRALDAEKEELEAFLELTESFYERGLIDLDTYLAARRTAIERSTAAEVRALEEQIRAERAGAAAGTPAEKGAAAIKIGDLQAQITAKRTEGEQKLQVLERLGTEKREQAALEALKLEAELEAAKGRTGEAAIRAIQAEYEERIRVARSPEAKAALQELQAQAVAKSDLSGKTQAADLGKARMDTALQAIDNNLAVGALSDAAAQEQRIQVYQRFLPLLRELAEAQLAAAQTTNDPALIQQAEAQLVNLQGQEAQLVRMKDTLADFKEAAADAFVDGFANFLATLADNTSSLTDKVKALGASIAQAVAQLAAMQIAKAAAGAMSFASGGLVLGPGTGTSDSIPAWLSNGEFVMRNAARSYYGADFMSALNGLRVPKEAIRGFADGGLVTPEPTPVPVRGEFSHRVELGLSDGLVLRALDTPEGARVITRMVGSNTKRFNRALGRG